jgi:hypothetical protein
VVDLAAQDRVILDAAKANLSHYGLAIDGAGCRQYPAAIGAEPYPFRLCPVTISR